MGNVTKLQPKKPRKKPGRELAPKDRDTVVEAIGRYGRDRVTHLLLSIDPNNPAPGCTMSDLLNDSHHRWLSRNFNALSGLAQYLRTNCQEEIRFPERSIVPRQKESAPALTTADHSSDLKLFMQQQMEQTRMLVGAVQAMTAVIQRPSAPPPSTLRLTGKEPVDNEDAELGVGDERAPREFHDQPVWFKRKVLRDIHSRVGERIKAESGGTAIRPHAEAWNRSYEAFHKETGIDIKGRASRLSDREGSQVRPVEIIQQLDELDRFYDVVKRVWDGWF